MLVRLQSFLRGQEKLVLGTLESALRSRKAACVGVEGSLPRMNAPILLNEINAGLLGEEPLMPQRGCCLLSLDEVRVNMRKLMNAEKLLVDLLHQKLDVSDEEWLMTRFLVSRCFQRIIANRSAFDCDHCHAHKEELLLKSHQMERRLRTTVAE